MLTLVWGRGLARPTMLAWAIFLRSLSEDVVGAKLSVFAVTDTGITPASSSNLTLSDRSSDSTID